MESEGEGGWRVRTRVSVRVGLRRKLGLMVRLELKRRPRQRLRETARRACGGGAGLLVRVAKLCHAPSVLPRHTPSSSTSFRARHRRARAREQLRQVAPLKGKS